MPSRWWMALGCAAAWTWHAPSFAAETPHPDASAPTSAPVLHATTRHADEWARYDLDTVHRKRRRGKGMLIAGSVITGVALTYWGATVTAAAHDNPFGIATLGIMTSVPLTAVGAPLLAVGITKNVRARHELDRRGLPYRPARKPESAAQPAVHLTMVPTAGRGAGAHALLVGRF